MSQVLQALTAQPLARVPSRSLGSLGLTHPNKQPHGNQATYLFFPVFVSLVLTLLGTLSASIIPGLSTVEVRSKYGDGVVKLGGWGMCIEQFPHYTAKCIPYSIFGNNTEALSDLPAAIWKMGINPSPVDDSFKIANGVMHATACFVAALAMFMTLAASGEYYRAGEYAKSWTRWAWWSNTAALIFGIVPFALDIACITKTAATAVLEDGSPAQVVPGTSIYLSAVAVLLNLITLFARYILARRCRLLTPAATIASIAHALPPAYDTNDEKLWPSTLSKAEEGDENELAQLPSVAYLPGSPSQPGQAPGQGQGQGVGGGGAVRGDLATTWHELNLRSAIFPNEERWSRADDAVAPIGEKRASLIKDGFAV